MPDQSPLAQAEARILALEAEVERHKARRNHFEDLLNRSIAHENEWTQRALKAERERDALLKVRDRLTAIVEKGDALAEAVLWIKERQDVHNYLTDKLIGIEKDINRSAYREDGWSGILKLRENVTQARMELISLCPDRSDIELSLAPVEFTSEEESAIVLANAYQEARRER